MTYLLDVNVLIALIDPTHVSHDAAHHWFEKAVAAGNEDAKLYLNPKAALGKKLAFIYLEPSKACSWD